MQQQPTPAPPPSYPTQIQQQVMLPQQAATGLPPPEPMDDLPSGTVVTLANHLY